MLSKNFWTGNSKIVDSIKPKLGKVYIKNDKTKVLQLIEGGNINLSNLNTTLRRFNITELNNNNNNNNNKEKKLIEDCQCDYLLEEVHYNLFMHETFMILTAVEIDVVLTKNITGSCNKRKIRRFKNSLTYLQTRNVNLYSLFIYFY